MIRPSRRKNANIVREIIYRRIYRDPSRPGGPVSSRKGVWRDQAEKRNEHNGEHLIDDVADEEGERKGGAAIKVELIKMLKKRNECRNSYGNAVPICSLFFVHTNGPILKFILLCKQM